MDDWAWRKGCSSYGTILVDLEQDAVADLLADRSAASFAKWLRAHPQVRIITRDRDSIYADGGRAGAPAAKQVADRFHLIQNLSHAVQDALAHQRDRLLIPAQEFVRNAAPIEASVGQSAIEEPEIPARPKPATGSAHASVAIHFDRLLPEKLFHAYELLLPDKRWPAVW